MWPLINYVIIKLPANLEEINWTTDLGIVVLGPLNAIKQVTEIGFHRNVMYVGLELLVEELVILRVLFEHNRVAGEKVRKTVRCHRSINVHLVFVLTTHFFCKRQLKHRVFIKCYKSETQRGCVGPVIPNNFIGEHRSLSGLVKHTISFL